MKIIIIHVNLLGLSINMKSMAVKINITRKDKFLESRKVIYLLDVFINEGFSGRRTRKDGNRISTGSVVNYVYLKRYLQEFEKKNHLI